MDLVKEIMKNPLPRELAFTKAEYDERSAKAQARMKAEGIDVLLISNTSNLGYLTGYDTTMPSGYTVGILQATGGVALHSSELEATCGLLAGVIEDFVSFRWYDAQDTAGHLGGVLRDRGLSRARIGLEMGYAETFASGAFDTKSYLRLKQMLPEAEFVDATLLVLDVRSIKTEKELGYMREAGRISALGLEAARNAAAEGLMDNDLVAAAHHAMISAGSELMSIDPMCMTGRRCGYMPHIPYRRTRLNKGDTIYLEFTGTFNRYNAPCMRSAVIGEPSDAVKRLSDAAIETVETLLANIRPGRTGAEVAAIAQKVLDRVPEAFFHGGFGYSIGMGFQPSWCEAPLYISEAEQRELKPGMTFHLPICAWVPAQYGIGFSESVVVTDTGCETLTPGTNRYLAVR